jgi:RNA polymerase sigma factor (sigma-70 family)
MVYCHSIPSLGQWPPQTGEIGATPIVATSMSDELGLHQRLLIHDIAALAEVYDQFAPTVFGVAMRVTTDRHAAEDVTQEVLLDLWRRPGRFDPERGALRPWLATIAHNRSVDWIRHERGARGRDRSNLERALADHVPDVDDDVQAWMTAQRVRQAVSALPEVEQLPIRLAYFSGRSYRQVAADLDVPEGTIKSRIRSGLRRLSLTMYAEHLVNA